MYGHMRIDRLHRLVTRNTSIGVGSGLVYYSPSSRVINPTTSVRCVKYRTSVTEYTNVVQMCVKECLKCVLKTLGHQCYPVMYRLYINPSYVIISSLHHLPLRQHNPPV